MLEVHWSLGLVSHARKTVASFARLGRDLCGRGGAFVVEIWMCVRACVCVCVEARSKSREVASETQDVGGGGARRRKHA